MKKPPLPRLIHNPSYCGAVRPVSAAIRSQAHTHRTGEYACGALGRETPQPQDPTAPRDERVANKAGLPLVSVIIPSYNHAQYIGQAIESVLAQTHRNIELIVIDDGSVDHSRNVISAYTADARVTVVLNDVNRGQGCVLNEGLDRASGDFIAFLPSDDWFLPQKIELQLGRFQDLPEDVGAVYSGGYRYFENKNLLSEVAVPSRRGWIARELISEGNFIYPVTPLFRREVFDHVRFNEHFKAEGEAIFIRIALRYKFDFIRQPLAVMRDHGYNIGKDVEVMYEQVSRYWEWFFSQPGLPERIRSLEPLATERLNRIKGMQFVGDARNFARGRQCLLKAIGLNPFLLFKPRIAASLAITFLSARFANAMLDRVKRRNVAIDNRS